MYRFISLSAKMDISKKYNICKRANLEDLRRSLHDMWLHLHDIT